MIVAWKQLLSESNIPQKVWPEKVEEQDSTASKNANDPFLSGTVTVITYPAELPVTTLDPATGKRQWNPELKDGIEIIYKAYRNFWGGVCAPAWSRSSNCVRFERT